MERLFLMQITGEMSCTMDWPAAEKTLLHHCHNCLCLNVSNTRTSGFWDASMPQFPILPISSRRAVGDISRSHGLSACEIRLWTKGFFFFACGRRGYSLILFTSFKISHQWFALTYPELESAMSVVFKV